ncbi:pectin acetylesterase, family CE13 [Zostera marina]|uniref:Pectin acetylesterase n=1 Tax=Zostera marina TaxID=29655 RepID=A0A0K9PVR9_ZOSMR|nr:pectin acetylesterase, family CE13 [Zostera marina]
MHISREMAIHRLRLWWTRGSGRDLVISVIGFGSLFIALIFTIAPLFSDKQQHYLLQDEQHHSPFLVDLTLLQNAHQKNAVCLDGSPAAYHFTKGFGSGSSSWIVHLEGGSWCSTVSSCILRKSTALGSSDLMEKQKEFKGILSNDASQNPDFFNWNKVKIRYCDGASFLGRDGNKNENKTGLFFRGQIIWESIMEELLTRGLKDASQALLTGCSAGGLATFFHCDSFHALLPSVARVKCFSDGGYFLDSKDISGAMTIRSFYRDVIDLHDLEKILPRDCIANKEASQCFFPQELIKFIDTPFLILNSAYDWWQIIHVLVAKKLNPGLLWERCMTNIQSCSQDQIKIINGFRETLISTLRDFQHRKDSGLYINSCYQHCQATSDLWHSLKINNKSIAEAVGDWYLDRDEVKIIDCAYPCNPTCEHADLSLYKFN